MKRCVWQCVCINAWQYSGRLWIKISISVSQTVRLCDAVCLYCVWVRLSFFEDWHCDSQSDSVTECDSGWITIWHCVYVSLTIPDLTVWVYNCKTDSQCECLTLRLCDIVTAPPVWAKVSVAVWQMCVWLSLKMWLSESLTVCYCDIVFPNMWLCAMMIVWLFDIVCLKVWISPYLNVCVLLYHCVAMGLFGF